jgi:hypothetical protein
MALPGQNEVRADIRSGATTVGKLRDLAPDDKANEQNCIVCDKASMQFHLLHGAREGSAVCPDCLEDMKDD